MKLLRQLIFPLIAVIAAFIVGGIIVVLIGGDPIETYELLIGSTPSWPDGIGYTLFNATPLIFTGLAVAVAFRCGLLNIGAEGQLYVAAFMTAWVGFTFASLPGWILVPLACLTAILSGAAWGAIPGVLKARFGSHEVINTIMMNFIAVALASYFTQYYYKDPSDPIMQTKVIGLVDKAQGSDGDKRAHPAHRRVHQRLSRTHPAQHLVHLRADCVRAGLRLFVADEVGL